MVNFVVDFPLTGLTRMSYLNLVKVLQTLEEDLSLRDQCVVFQIKFTPKTILSILKVLQIYKI